MRDVSTGLRAELEFSVAGMTANGGGKSVVSVPWIGKRLGVVNFILDGTGLEKRKYPLKTEVTCGVQEDISLKLAGGFTGRRRCRRLRRWTTIASAISSILMRTTVRSNVPATLKLKAVEFSPRTISGPQTDIEDAGR